MKIYTITIFMFHLILSPHSKSLLAQPMKKDTIIRPTTFESSQLIDSASKNKTQKDDSTTKESWRQFTNYFRLDFFTTLNANYYLNSLLPLTERNNFYIYYCLNITNQLKTKYISLNTFIYNEFGYRKYLDSINIKSDDQYYYKFDLSSPIHQQLNLACSYQVKSQLWKSWEFKLDSNQKNTKSLYSDYFSPGYITYSLGIAYSFWSSSRVELGLAGGQITKIKNSTIYETRNSNELYGLEKGTKRKMEFGLNLQIQVPAKRIGRFVYWENSSRLFIKNNSIPDLKARKLDVSNGFHFLFLKYLRLGLKSKINYDLEISPKIYLNNTLLFGFYLSNKL